MIGVDYSALVSITVRCPVKLVVLPPLVPTCWTCEWSVSHDVGTFCTVAMDWVLDEVVDAEDCDAYHMENTTVGGT